MSIKEALDELLEDLMRLAASYEMAGHDESRRLDAEVAAAKAAVLALYEKQKRRVKSALKVAGEATDAWAAWKAIADELAEALTELVDDVGVNMLVCTTPTVEDKVKAALAAYEKAKEG